MMRSRHVLGLSLLAATACSAPSVDRTPAGPPAATPVGVTPHSEATSATPPSTSPRASFAAGLSFALLAGARAALPQGIDSAVMHIAGDGFEMMADDYGAWRGPATHTLGGRQARMSERRTRGCRERVWEVELPTTNSTMLQCTSPTARSGACHPMNAHVNISSFCTTEASCRTVDAIIDSARFDPPGQAMPRVDAHWTPPAPVCRIEEAQ